MKLKKKSLRSCLLYVVIDRNITGGRRHMVPLAKKIKSSQVDMIQLRDKHSPKPEVLKEALSLKKIFSSSNKLFIINDYPDIAKIAGLDGVHLGASDMPVEEARRLLGKKMIIGASCHTLKQAQAAKRMGADYIGMGPVFPTKTKLMNRPLIDPALARDTQTRLKIPVFAIGGINRENLKYLSRMGINRVAACTGICRQKNIASTVKEFRKYI